MGIPTVAPNSPGRTASFLSWTSMDRLEGIDVSIGLIEISVVVIVIAVIDIELAQVLIDLSRSFPNAIWASYQLLIESWRKFQTFESGLSS